MPKARPSSPHRCSLCQRLGAHKPTKTRPPPEKVPGRGRKAPVRMRAWVPHCLTDLGKLFNLPNPQCP